MQVQVVSFPKWLMNLFGFSAGDSPLTCAE